MMNVGFLVFADWFEFGYSETLYSWFSTICYKLEDKKWGSRFPIVMNNLYFDEEYGVAYEQLEDFKKELETIKLEFSKLKQQDAIWSFEDNILKVPIDMPNINYNANTLETFFVSKSAQKTIFDVLKTIIEDMQFYKKRCRIVSEKDLLSIPKT